MTSIFSCLQVVLNLLFISILIGFSTTNAEKERCPADEKKDWYFRLDLPNGPQYWKEAYPDCNGRKQSPINIVTDDVVKGSNPQTPLQITNFDVPFSKIKVLNIGKNLVLFTDDNVKRTINLDGEDYTFHSFHFHWGNETNMKGSEHAINGKKTPLEAHFLFLHPDGTWAEVSSLIKINRKMNPVFDRLFSVKPKFEYDGDVFEGNVLGGDIDFRDLVDLKCPYYRYAGSMAIPPCPETVTWMICKTYKYINKSQLEQFFTVDSVKKDQDTQNDCSMTNIHRPLQHKNDRKVYD